MKVFVTDGDNRPALAIVRALGRRGMSVLVGEQQSDSLASASKYCVRHVTYPSPYEHRQAFDEFLLDFVVRERIDVVLPVTDVTTHSVCLNRVALGRSCATAVPPFDAFDFVADKWRLVEAASRCGVPTPRTCLVPGITGLKDVVGAVEYPAVVKPVRSRIPTADGWLGATVQYAYSESELWRAYEESECLASYASLIQERIVGSGVGMFALFDRGELLVDFAHRRLREKPPAGGASVLCESARVDPRLRDYAVRLLGPIGWHGVAMLEFKQDARTGDFFLMEVNGRFWGSLQLAIDAGVDFPFLACELAQGRRPQGRQPYAVGVKSRWLLGDLDHLLMRLFRSDRTLHLPDSSPSRWRALADFLSCADRDLHHDVISRDDPHPFLYELRRQAGALSASARRRARRLVTRIEGEPCSRPRGNCESSGLVG